MADYNFKDLLDKVTDPEVKAGLEAEITRINKERGEFGAKLKIKDTEIDALKASTMEYGKAHKILEKNGVKAEDIPAMLEKLGVQKTVQDENVFLSETLKARTSELTELRNKVHRYDTEKAVGKLFEAARTALKDPKGNPVKIADHFIDIDKLYEGITDFSNEAVLKEKINKMLEEAAVKQATVLGDLGFQGVAVHATPGEKQGPAAVATTSESLRKISQEYSPAAAITAFRNAQKG